MLVFGSPEEKDYRTKLLVDGRYRNYAESLETDDVSVEQYRDDKLELLSSILEEEGPDRIYFEEDNLTYSDYLDVNDQLESQFELHFGDDLVMELRENKKTGELDRIREAISLTLDVFDLIDEWIEPGLTEQKLSRFIRSELENRGDALSFSPLVLSGENTARPHSPATDRVIEDGDPILVDMGLKIDGYCSDLTRMFFQGTVDSELRNLYEISKRAAAEAFDSIHSGMEASRLNEIAHSLISEAGYSENIRHGLGHGVGLNVHESPSLSSSSDEKLEPGMVVTLEPGIYIDGAGGGRIEHMVLIQENGVELLDEPDQYLEDVIDSHGNDQ